jgi:hypothetical protein
VGFRTVLCISLSAIALAAAITVAVALPAVCPPGFHDGRGTVACISDARHMAASGTGMIPDEAMLSKDPRTRLRVELALVGVLTGACLLIVGLGGRRFGPDGDDVDELSVA